MNVHRAANLAGKRMRPTKETYDEVHLALWRESNQRWPALAKHRFAFYKWKLCRLVCSMAVSGLGARRA